MMRCCSKEKISCKPLKMEKDITHVCPSKLSKRELQDLYFTVMQTNVELKQTINQLNDKIRNQGTKLQRMLATQRAYMGSENRDCCATVKAVVQEQKHIIVDLKNYNDNLKEQVKNLNMKLCSTKQFLKRGIPKERDIPKHNCGVGRAKQSSPRTDSAKNSSTSALHSKTSEQHSMGKKSVSCQHLDTLASVSARKPKDVPKNEILAMRIDVKNKLCDQNKCRTQMEELQQKIVNLQKELIKTHDEYAKRIERLEKEVVELHSENMRIRTEKAVWEHKMNATANESSETKKKLAESEANREQLSAKLNIEKGKVAELQTQLKAANMTSGAVKAVEERLNDNKQKDDRRNPTTSARYNSSSRPGSSKKENSNNEESSQESPGKIVGLNTNTKPEEYSDARKSRTNNPNQSEIKKCCEKKKCPETLATNLINESPNFTYSNPFAIVNISDEPNTNRGPETKKRCCNAACPAKLRRLTQMKEYSDESSSSNTSRFLVCPSKTDPQRLNRQNTEASQNQSDTNESSAENSNATRQDSVQSRSGSIDNRRDSVSSRKDDNSQESYDGNRGDNGTQETKRDNRQNIPQRQCKCIKEECEDVSSGEYHAAYPQGATKSGICCKNKTENGQLSDNQTVNQRINNKIGETETRNVPEKSPVDYSTEYRSKYVDPRAGSMGFQPTLQSPIEGEASSPVMSELVNNSNESSCYCSGQCTCINTDKTTRTRGETAVSAFAPNQSGGQASPLSTEEQTLLQKFLALLLPSFVGSDEAAINKPVNETSDPQSAADTSTAKTTDDSGFTEANKSTASDKDKGLTRANQDLIKRVAELQSQLDQLKLHVLSRRATYTILKDGETQQENTMMDSGRTYRPGEIQGQTSGDERRMDSKYTPGGYPDQSNMMNRYAAAGPSEPQRTCESTCGKEGLNCTKECRLKKQTEDFNNTDTKKNVTRRYEDNRYQIPGPLPMITINKNPESDPNSDIPIRKRYRDSISVQKDHIKNSQIDFSRNNNNQQNFDMNHQNPNFHQRYNAGFQANAPYIKEESPPTNPQQNIYLRNSIGNPALLGNSCLMREESPPNIYTKDQPVSPTQESTAITNAQYATDTRETMRPYTDRPQASENQNFGESANTRPYQFAVGPNVQNTNKSEIMQQPVDCTETSKNQPLQCAENSKTNGGEIAPSCTCPTAKNTPTNCMCSRLEYTTNVVHTCTIQKRLPYNETGKSQAQESFINLNAGNALSSNVQQYDQSHQKTNVNFPNVSTAQNINNTQVITNQKPENLNTTQILENKEKSGKLPTLQELMGNYEVNKDAERRKDGVTQSKQYPNIEENRDRLNKGPLFTVDTDGNAKQTENYNSQRINNFENNSKNEDTDMKARENYNYPREAAMIEANKIQRENQSNKTDKIENAVNEFRSNLTTDNDDLRKNRGELNRRETRFDEKSIRGDVNIDDKISPTSYRGGHLLGKQSENRFAEKSAENQVNDLNKIQRQSRIVNDSNDNRFIEKTTGIDLNNTNKSQQNRYRESAATTFRGNEDDDDAVELQQKDLFYNNPGAPKPSPVATSSPYGPVTKIDKVTSNQLGTQLSDGGGDKGTDPMTYTINSSVNVVEETNEKAKKYTRATSPENTDQEISSMTDLPSERETGATSPWKCAKLCPGKEKTTTTSTDSAAPTSSTPVTTGTTYSLSEGEMPQYSAKPVNRTNSTYMDPDSNYKNQERAEKCASENVSKALASISEELTRCRLLLEKPREATPVRLKDLMEAEEQKETRSKMSETDSEGAIALRRSEAKPHISNGPNTPHVLFTLHIGTVVLSDEAVINSRNMSLVLTWKFYDQNVAMSHMRPGRVVHFDFSTEYDLKLSDDFLQYMKSEELQIKVCEVNKLDSPVASCSLPLREPLLHTNKRADMSLALVAGPRMQRASPAADALDTRDEMGVLDLWCMLRAEPRIVPFINKAISISRPSRTSGATHQNLADSALSPLVMQLDDDQSEVRLTTDLDPAYYNNQNNSRVPVSNPKVQNNQSMFDRGYHGDGANVMRQSDQTGNYGYNINASNATIQATTNRFIPGRRVSISKAPPDTLSIRSTATTNDLLMRNPSMSQSQSSKRYDDKTIVGERDIRRTSSGFIINEIPAVIRSDEEMKQAVTSRSAGISGRKSMAPTLQDKYEQALAHTKPEPRISYGQFSIPSLRDPRIKHMSSQGLHSINRNWNKMDDKDPSQKRYMDTETPTRERRASCNTVADSRFEGARMAMDALRSVKTKQTGKPVLYEFPESHEVTEKQSEQVRSRAVDITIIWLALNEECSAMNDSNVQRLYVAYNFLGRGGAELETPVSLPKPKSYSDKCYFNFRMSFQLTDSDLYMLSRMAKCRSSGKGKPGPNDCVVFTVVSEPVEDPLGLNNCEDIGTAQLFFGDLLVFSAGSDTYTEVIPIRDSKDANTICGVLSIRVDGLDVVRKCVSGPTEANN